MYVVIFRATVASLDDDYYRTAERLRERALAEFGCVRFESFSENGEEIALSYWSSLEQIKAWRKDSAHRIAQQKGRSGWYKHYRVEIAQIQRSYNV